MSDSFFPRWPVQPDASGGRVVAADERLPWPQMIAMGVQHVVATFGSTVLTPLLMGFDPNLCISSCRASAPCCSSCWSADACRAISGRASRSSDS